jgi:citrate lyase subunit alpha/citrate CoA-transferase
VDVVVTEAGVAVNPAREELADRLRHAGLPVVQIDALVAQAGPGGPADVPEGPVVAVSEYRDGSVIDAVRGRGTGGSAAAKT